MGNIRAGDVIIIALGLVAAIFDLRVKRIPNCLVITIFGAWAISMATMLFINTESAISLLKDSLLGILFGGGLFLSVYLVSRRGLGGGDVKFMAGAGLCLGFSGTVTAMFCGTLLAAMTGLALIILRKLGRKDKIPLVPFLYLGILVTVIGNLVVYVA